MAGKNESVYVRSATQTVYPGELAKPKYICRLADEYRKADYLLLTSGRRGNPLSRAPYQLSAVQAIELYLSALLLRQGYEPARIRGMQHDLASRAELAIAGGVQLRKRTTAHLNAMTRNREYLVTRYSPEMTMSASQINRLTATFEEVAIKVTRMMNIPGEQAAAEKGGPVKTPD